MRRTDIAKSDITTTDITTTDITTAAREPGADGAWSGEAPAEETPAGSWSDELPAGEPDAERDPLAGTASAAKPRPDRFRPGRRKLLALGLATAILLCGGTALGTTLPDPTRSVQYLSLGESKATVVWERDTLQSEYAGLQSRYSTLSSGIAAREAKATTREADVSTTETAVKAAEAVVKAREEAVTGAEKQKAANTVKEGTWVVGTDIEPGTYRASAEVGSSCYWGIYASGSNGAKIIDNGIPGGGRPSVSLTVGQDFKSARCGTWNKQ